MVMMVMMMMVMMMMMIVMMMIAPLQVHIPKSAGSSFALDVQDILRPLHLISQEGCLSLHRRNSSARNRWMVDGGGFTVAFVSRCPRKEQRTWMQRHYFPDIMFHVMLFYWAGFGTNNGGVRVQHTCSNYLSISLFIINIYIHCTYIINMYLYIIYIIIYILYIYVHTYYK